MKTVEASVKTREKGRMHFRLDSKIKARVAQAAALTGQGLTDFAVATLTEKADEILERNNSIVFNDDDYKFFLNALVETPAPSTRSVAAAKRYRRGERKGVRHHLAD